MPRRSYRPLLLVVEALFFFWLAPSATAQIPKGAVWKYLDNGTNQGTAWREPAFDDSSWQSGPAQLGYGDGDEATVVSFGPNPNNKPITTYFRRTFTMPARPAGLRLRLLRDDGAVVYLNGVEVFRSNMPVGPISSTTPASTAVGGTEERTLFFETTVDPAVLQIGTNVVAVEVHQESKYSTDISFDLELIADTSVQLTRGPYLQSGSTNSVVIRWRTSSPTDSRVLYGTRLDDMSSHHDDPALTTEHEVRLTGLAPATTYYYAIGSTAELLAGGDDRFFFLTAPSGPVPTRIWVLGDSGQPGSGAQAVRNAYMQFSSNRHTNLWLMLGDNAYVNGTDAEYQVSLFDMYPDMLRKSVLWPSIGNHDTAGSYTPPDDFPYIQMFTLPTNGEAGGLPSGTERYYSFDYGNIHFIVLDSMSSDRSSHGAMLTWLRNDVAATSKDWIIAYWHHPPYTMGSHDSDVEEELVEMRTNALPILEAGGVDLVLAGHSHSYERSFLLNGHYGTSDTLAASHIIDGGSGREDGSGAYRKEDVGPVPNGGAVYAVSGSSSQTSGGALNHPAMVISLNVLGSMVIDVDGNRLDAKLLRQTGAIDDYFTIVKGGPLPSPAAPSSLSAIASSHDRVELSWTDASNSEEGFKLERSSAGAAFVVIATLGANLTSYTDASVEPSTSYTYRVQAFNDSGVSEYSNTSTATTPAGASAPSAPTGVSASADSSSSIRVQWNDVSSNEDGFKVERSNGGAFQEVATLAADAAEFADSGLEAATAYNYRVLAFNAAGPSEYSNTATATTLAAPAPPSGPTGATASAESSSLIRVRWTDASGNEDGFKIERSNGGAFQEVATLAADMTEFADSGLEPSTAYSYRVLAFNAAGPSEYSNTATATTLAAPAPPAAPTGATATAESSERIRVQWTDASSNEDGFKVERSNGGLFQVVATLAAGATALSDSGLQSSTTYSYRVAAFNAIGSSQYSETATATTLPSTLPPAAPSGLEGTAVSSTRIDLRWNDNSTTEAGIELERSSNGKTFALLQMQPANSTSYSDTSGSPNTFFYYRVRAVNQYGASAYSNVLKIKTKAR